MKFEIIATGSSGNAVLIEDSILIDCGVPFKAIKGYSPKLKLVLLTHVHHDHFNKTTIRRLAQDRPTLRFGCGVWLVPDLRECGVNPANIDVMTYDTEYRYSIASVIPVRLFHDVPNCGYKLVFPLGKVFYATDTSDLYGIEAKDFDLYLIEANYTDQEIAERIAEKDAAGEFAYERRVLDTHLSKEKCDEFLDQNKGENSECVYLHAHKGGSTDWRATDARQDN